LEKYLIVVNWRGLYKEFLGIFYSEFTNFFVPMMRFLAFAIFAIQPGAHGKVTGFLATHLSVFSGVLTRKEWKCVIDFSHAVNAEIVTSFATSSRPRDPQGVAPAHKTRRRQTLQLASVRTTNEGRNEVGTGIRGKRVARMNSPIEDE